MSPTELEARRWRAAVDAAWRRNGLTIRILPVFDDKTMIALSDTGIDSDASELWSTLMEPGRTKAQIGLICRTAEWVEMLAQGST